MRTYDEDPPQFAKQDLINTYKLLELYCVNKQSCKIMLAKTYHDFKNNSANNMNWYNGYLDITSTNDDSSVLIEINSEAELRGFIEKFNNYLNQNADMVSAYGYGNFYNNPDDILNQSDLFKSFSIYDSTNENQIRFLGNNLTNVKIESTDYYFDIKLKKYGFDQYETVRILHQHCTNITTLKIQIIDINIFRRVSFRKLLQNTTKLKISLLNEEMYNFDTVSIYIKSLMNKCTKINSLTLHVSKSEYLKPFLDAKYQSLKKINIISGELYDNDLISTFQNVNTMLNQIHTQSRIVV